MTKSQLNGSKLTFRNRQKIHPRTLDKYLDLQLEMKKGMMDLAQDSEDSVHSETEMSKVLSKRRKWFSTSSRLQFVTRPSLLSVDTRISSHNYKGIINLIILMLIVSHTRLMLENIMKYGLLVSLKPMELLLNIKSSDCIPVLLLALLFLTHAFVAYMNEVLAKNSSTIYRKPRISDDGKIKQEQTYIRPNQPTETIVFFVHLLNVISILVVPIWFIFKFNTHPIVGLVIELASIILFLKLISYAHMNYRYRHRVAKELDHENTHNHYTENYKLDKSSKKDLNTDSSSENGDEESSNEPIKHYPENIGAVDMLYFLCAPTLVYQEHFPRSKKIRWDFVIKRCLEVFLCSVAILFLAEQYMLPLVQNAMEPMANGQWMKIIERMLKMTIPTILVWLLGFYTFFHAYLNIVAELLRFGDRLFYMDFWNSTSLAKFWRTWNIPVSQWMIFHIYLPLIKNNICGQKIASLLVFLVSAVFHELVISIPFRTFKMWAFGAMIVQMPLCIITEKYTKGRVIGNMIFWLSFLFGQSNLVIFYFYESYKKQQML